MLKLQPSLVRRLHGGGLIVVVVLWWSCCVCHHNNHGSSSSDRGDKTVTLYAAVAAAAEAVTVEDNNKPTTTTGGVAADEIDIDIMETMEGDEYDDEYDDDDEEEKGQEMEEEVVVDNDDKLTLQAAQMLSDKFLQAVEEVKEYLSSQQQQQQQDQEQQSRSQQRQNHILRSSVRQFLTDNQLVNDLQSFHYADRHVKEIQDIPYDEDCMTREFDLQDPSNYNMEEAADVLYKCRLLILRNVHDTKYIDTFRNYHGKYLRALQQGKTTINKKVLYDDIRRYELLLPKEHYVSEIAENRHILNLLEMPQLLDSNMFIHSFGTSITEPGTPHQYWHEEDNYIFDSSDSFELFGIAGHDLPPYTINMFTPLLNVTYDHGPTEFCVGSSILTGLYRGYPLFNKNIKQGTDFDELYQFGYETLFGRTGGSYPCPPQFLRSTTLNVGDVVLFDYQILHRAGHNLSNDTRAQIYVAYSRPWFRDLNYHYNTHGDDIYYGSKTAHTRFIEKDPSNPDEVFEVCETVNCENEPPIESIRAILGKHSPPAPSEYEPNNEEDDLNDDNENEEKNDDDDDDDTHGKIMIKNKKKKRKYRSITFYVSIVDLDAGTSIYLDDQLVHTLEQDGPKEVEVTDAYIGSKLSIVSSTTGEIYKTWKVPFQLYQLMVSKAILGISSTTNTNDDGNEDDGTITMQPTCSKNKNGDESSCPVDSP